jgi:hypothetical protein
VFLQTGPVRLFTPYKRRKRKDTSDGEGSAPRKLKRAVSKDGSNGEDSDAGNYIISPLHLIYLLYIYIYIYRVSQEESARLREGVPYVKIYRYISVAQRKVWSSGESTHCTYQLRSLSCCPCVRCPVIAHSSHKLHMYFLQSMLWQRCEWLIG